MIHIFVMAFVTVHFNWALILVYCIVRYTSFWITRQMLDMSSLYVLFYAAFFIVGRTSGGLSL